MTGLTVTTAGAGSIDGDAASGYTFTANANYNGPVELTYSVTDGTESTSATASFNIFSVNDAPELADGTTNPFSGIDEDGTLPISRDQLLTGFSDVESDNSDLTIKNLAVTAGSISGNPADGWTYTPAADFNGEVTLSYAVTDPDGGTTLAAYTFNVAAINDAPERAGDQLTLGGTQEDATSFSITESQLLAGYFDRDGDTLSVTGLTLVNTASGSLDGDPANGWTFTPTKDFNAPLNSNTPSLMDLTPRIQDRILQPILARSRRWHLRLLLQ